MNNYIFKFLKPINKIISITIILALMSSLVPINIVSIAKASEPVLVKEMQNKSGEIFTVGTDFIGLDQEQLQGLEGYVGTTTVYFPGVGFIEVPIDEYGNPLLYIPIDTSDRVINDPFKNNYEGGYPGGFSNFLGDFTKTFTPGLLNIFNPVGSLLNSGGIGLLLPGAPIFKGYAEVAKYGLKALGENDFAGKEWLKNKANSVKDWAKTKEGTGYVQAGIGLVEVVGGVSQMFMGASIAASGTVFGFGVGGVVAVPVGMTVGVVGALDTASGIERIYTGLSNIFSSDDAPTKKEKGNIIQNAISKIDNSYIRGGLTALHIATGLVSARNIFKNIPKLYNGAKTKIKNLYNITKGLYDDVIRNSDDVGEILNKLNPFKKIHGNSLNSPKKTYLYNLMDEKTGEHLKYGITSNDPAIDRYTKKFMMDKEMEILDQGSRIDIYNKEADLIQNNPRGLLQKNNH